LFPILILLIVSITLPFGGSDEGFDFELGVRFAGYALAALVVLFALGQRRLRLNFAIVAWAMVPIFIAATALYSLEPSFSLVAGLAHLTILLFAWCMVHRYGQPRTVFAFVMTGLIIGLLSIFAYYVFPDIGRSAAGTLSSEISGRMQGVTAQPNSLGLIAALTILLAVMHLRAFTPRQRQLAIVAICVAAFCAIFADSRTSFLALLVCLGLWGLHRANAALNLFGIVGIALIACLLIGFVPDVADLLTREGSRTDDLASFNGRWKIWSVAWEYITDHPYIGQGYGSSELVLQRDDRLFAAAVNTHSVYLELLFSGGAVLLALYVFAVILAVVRSARDGRAEALIAMMFFFVVGVAEATPYGGLPLFSAAVFYMAVSLCLGRSAPPTPARQVLSPSPSGPRVVPGLRQGAIGRLR
jgi:O-antigen ligase